MRTRYPLDRTFTPSSHEMTLRYSNYQTRQKRLRALEVGSLCSPWPCRAWPRVYGRARAAASNPSGAVQRALSKLMVECGLIQPRSPEVESVSLGSSWGPFKLQFSVAILTATGSPSSSPPTSSTIDSLTNRLRERSQSNFQPFRLQIKADLMLIEPGWVSGRRGSNPQLQPWEGCTLPLSYSRGDSDLAWSVSSGKGKYWIIYHVALGRLGERGTW